MDLLSRLNALFIVQIIDQTLDAGEVYMALNKTRF